MSGSFYRVAAGRLLVCVVVIVGYAGYLVGQGGAPAPAPPAGGGFRNGPNDAMVVDPAAADRGRSTWVSECITCHGSTGRGTDDGPNILRSPLVIRNRNGDELGPFLKKGHRTQSGKSSGDIAEAQVLELSHFLRQRLTDTLRSSPLFVPQNVLTGDAKAGDAFFHGAGRCTTCHSPTGNLAGIGRKYDPVTIQQRLLFPMAGAGGRGRAAGPAVSANPVKVAITSPAGDALSGDLVQMDDFTITVRDDAGVYRTLQRRAGMRIERTDPFERHIALLDVITDKQMHDLVAYLETLK